MSTKRKLTLASGILNLVGALSSILSIFLTFMLIDSPELLQAFTFEGFTYDEIYLLKLIVVITMSISATIQASAGICSTIAGASKTEEEFNSRKKLFIAGFVLSVISNPLSIASILMYVTCGTRTNDKCFTEEGKTMCNPQMNLPTQQNPTYMQQPQQTFQPMEQTQPNDPQTDDFKKKVTELKKLKEQGLITEEEYKALFMKLL